MSERERDERWLFASDVHLSLAAPQRTELFHRFLREEATGTTRLYILGDLFDVYVGRRHARRPEVAATLAELARLRDAGVIVELVVGNRDFMARDELGLDAVHAEDIVVDCGELKLLLSHGDRFCTRDRSYQRARRVLRSPVIRGLGQMLPVGVVLAVGDWLRGKSRSAVAAKSSYATDLDVSAVVDALQRLDVDAVVVGHVHRRRDLVARIDGKRRRFVGLGDWSDTGCFAELSGAKLRLREFPPPADASS